MVMLVIAILNNSIVLLCIAAFIMFIGYQLGGLWGIVLYRLGVMLLVVGTIMSYKYIK